MPIEINTIGSKLILGFVFSSFLSIDLVTPSLLSIVAAPNTSSFLVGETLLGVGVRVFDIAFVVVGVLVIVIVGVGVFVGAKVKVGVEVGTGVDVGVGALKAT